MGKHKNKEEEMKFLLLCILALAVLGKESLYSKEEKVNEFLKKEGSSECPGPFTWNKSAKRCQRLIESGNTQFIKTSCCVNMIKELEKQVEKKIDEVKKEKCPLIMCPFVMCLNGSDEAVDEKGCKKCPVCKASPYEAEKEEVASEETPSGYEAAPVESNFNEKMDGEWFRDDGSSIVVAHRGGNKIHVSGEILRVRTRDNVNMGDFSGMSTLEEATKGVVAVNADCAINFEFENDFTVLKISQEGSDADCGFGFGVYADGDYTKTRPTGEIEGDELPKRFVPGVIGPANPGGAKKGKIVGDLSEEVKKEAQEELYKEIEAEETRKEAAKEEEEKKVEEAGHESAPIEAYETEESEIDSPSTSGCMKKCYYRKYEGAPKRQINCAKLHKYKGRRDCFKGGKKVECKELKCQLVHEVEVEKKEVKCRRVCYYRPFPGSRTKKRIPCRHVDTKYVGDKKCAVNGVRTPCSKLTCN